MDILHQSKATKIGIPCFERQTCSLQEVKGIRASLAYSLRKKKINWSITTCLCLSQ